jgi:23S rRNA G2069 N7-methylase RlmK/C1962 C5-methylase RlmI
LLEIGKIDDIQANEFLVQLPERVNRIPRWYKRLVRQARAYLDTGGTLSLAPSLNANDLDFDARALIEAEFSSTVDRGELEALEASGDEDQNAIVEEESSESDDSEAV